jgi:hypothetical protein
VEYLPPRKAPAVLVVPAAPSGVIPAR